MKETLETPSPQFKRQNAISARQRESLRHHVFPETGKGSVEFPCPVTGGIGSLVPARASADSRTAHSMGLFLTFKKIHDLYSSPIVNPRRLATGIYFGRLSRPCWACFQPVWRWRWCPAAGSTDSTVEPLAR
jgi:hypothetical protein